MKLFLKLAQNSDGDRQATAFVVALSAADSLKGILKEEVLCGVWVTVVDMEKTHCC